MRLSALTDLILDRNVHEHDRIVRVGYFLWDIHGKVTVADRQW